MQAALRTSKSKSTLCTILGLRNVATNQILFKGVCTPDDWVIAKLINLSKSFFASMDVRKHRSHPKRERSV